MQVPPQQQQQQSDDQQQALASGNSLTNVELASYGRRFGQGQ